MIMQLGCQTVSCSPLSRCPENIAGNRNQSFSNIWPPLRCAGFGYFTLRRINSVTSGFLLGSTTVLLSAVLAGGDSQGEELVLVSIPKDNGIDEVLLLSVIGGALLLLMILSLLSCVLCPAKQKVINTREIDLESQRQENKRRAKLEDQKQKQQEAAEAENRKKEIEAAEAKKAQEEEIRKQQQRQQEQERRRQEQDRLEKEKREQERRRQSVLKREKQAAWDAAQQQLLDQPPRYILTHARLANALGHDKDQIPSFSLLVLGHAGDQSVDI